MRSPIHFQPLFFLTLFGAVTIVLAGPLAPREESENGVTLRFWVPPHLKAIAMSNAEWQGSFMVVSDEEKQYLDPHHEAGKYEMVGRLSLINAGVLQPFSVYFTPFDEKYTRVMVSLFVFLPA